MLIFTRITLWIIFDHLQTSVIHLNESVNEPIWSTVLHIVQNNCNFLATWIISGWRIPWKDLTYLLLSCFLRNNNNDDFISSAIFQGDVMSGRVATNRTSTIHPQPLIDAISMETMLAISYASECLLNTKIRQAYGAWPIIKSGDPEALSEHHLGVRVNGGLIKPCRPLLGPWCHCYVVCYSASSRGSTVSPVQHAQKEPYCGCT